MHIYTLKDESDDNNFTYLICGATEAAVVDPGNAELVIDALRVEDLPLAHILVTHHHVDHTAGCRELKDAYGCDVIGPDDMRLPCLDLVALDGEDVEAGPALFRVLSVPGHTRTHVAFHSPALGAVFTGDTMFTAGCGRVFEGRHEDLLCSLQRLAMLPDTTRVYGGHDYIRKNLDFSRRVDPGNPHIVTLLQMLEEHMWDGEAIAPLSLRAEKLVNPFLRCGSEGLRNGVGLPNGSELEVFRRLRDMKDRSE